MQRDDRITEREQALHSESALLRRRLEKASHSESEMFRQKLEGINKDIGTFAKKEETKIFDALKVAGPAIFVMAAMLVLGLLIFKSGVTGQIIGGEEYSTYIQTIDANITESSESTWELDEHPAAFNLHSVKISGVMRGEGIARVYLNSNGRKYKILDEDKIITEGLQRITGSVVNVPDTATPPEDANGRWIKTILEYNSGTKWDTDNNGVAYKEDGVVDLTVANSEFNWPAEESKLCTKWVVSSQEAGTDTTVCNGNAECCALANVAPEEEMWDAPLYIFQGKYSATENNVVRAQVVFLNQSMGEEMYFESTTGTASELEAKFIPKPIIYFEEICAESCTLAEGFSDTEYTLEFEIGEGVELYIENITYSLEDTKSEDNAPIPASSGAEDTNVSYETVKTDARYDAIVDETLYDNATDTLTVVFHHDSATLLPISVKGNIDYVLDKESSRAGENVTLTVTNWSDNRFRIVVGSHTEVLEFGDARKVKIHPGIKNSRGNSQRARVRFVDNLLEETVKETTEDITETTIDEGEYDLDMTLENMSVKTIRLKSAQIYDNSTEFIKVEDVETSKISGIDAVKSYAIDPTSINFTNATVTVTATGTELYKCKEWDFEMQQCNGTWTYLQSITPGQEYTFVLTPDDPGLVESNGTFFEGFESGSFTTNNWTRTGVATNWTATTTNPYAGTYHAEAQPQSTTEPASTLQTTISTVGYQSINFSYYRRLVGIDAADEFKVKWYNGSAWTTVEETLDTSADDASYSYKTFALGSSAANRTDFAIRFECTAGAVSEYCRIDNVSVRSTSTVAIIPTQGTPVLSSSSGTNTTSENLTCYNQSTYDPNGDSVKSIFNWYMNSTSITALNLQFDGGSNASYTKDYSGNSNNGAVTGADWSSTSGQDGFGAYDFVNGNNDYINAGTGSSLSSFNNGYTIMVWIYPESFGQSNYGRIAQKSDGSSAGYVFYLSNVFATTQTYEGMRLMHYPGSDYAETNDYVISLNTWQHVAVTYINGVTNFYVNGNNVTEDGSISTYTPDTSTALYIGNRAALDREFDGKIDDLKMFNKALSQAEIQAIYNGRNDRMVSQELALGDAWKCAVTPNDKTQDGTTLESNTVTIVAGAGSNTSSPYGWTAYNDFTGGSPTNVTTILGGSSGQLKNYATNQYLPVNMSASGGTNGGTSIGALTSGTDAYSLFNGIINPATGIWYYGDDHTITFTGLNSSRMYRFVHFADRGAYSDRYSNITISDVTSFTVNSSTGVTIRTQSVTNDTATYRTGNNTYLGYVAGFTNINPGSDGDMTITVGSDDAHEYTSAIMLQELVNATPDSTAPTVTIISPQNSSTDTDGLVTVQYNTTDAESVVSSCELIINGAVKETNSSITESSTISFARTGLLSGANIITVNCTSTGGEGTASATVTVASAIFEDTFTSSGGFTTDDNNTAPWERGALNKGGVTCYDDSGCWVTDLEDYYVASGPYDDYITLTSPLDLSSYENVTLWFYHYRYFEDASTLWDAGVADINNSGSWERLIPNGGYSGTVDGTAGSTLAGQQAYGYHGTGWELAIFNLTNYSGTSATIRFHFAADMGANDAGWAIDRLRISGDRAANSAPTQGTPILNSSSGTNYTTENLTCYNQSTYDADGNSVKSIFNWYKNSTSIAVLNMPFEGGSNSTYTKDYSGNSNHGTVSTATWSSTSGRDGKGAYTFNGSAYIDAGNSSTLLVGTRFTEEAWIYPTLSDTNYHGIMGYEPGLTAQRAPSIWIYNLTRIHAGFGNGTTWDGFITDAIITENAWNHVVVTFDGTNYTVYVNGTSRYSTTSHAGRVPYATHIRDIGRVDNYFNGTIDEARVYNRSLSAQEVAYLYQTGANRIMSQELSAGDVWKCAVTPNDGTVDGSTTESNTLTIRSAADTTPPATVTGLANRSATNTSIYWNWTNPGDADFSAAILYLNGTNVANTSNNYYNATSLSCGMTYNIRINTKDTTGNINTTNVNSTATTLACADTTPPATVTSLTNTSSGTTWIRGGWTNPADADFSAAIVYVNNSNLANTSSNYYNATGLACGTSYTIKLNTKDTTGNVNTTNVNSSAATATCPDTAAPTWSNNRTKPTTNSTYSPTQQYQFNITWTDNVALSTARVEHNFTGTLANYSTTGSSGSEYYYNYTTLAVGTYVWRMYANDTSGNTNQTTQWTYTVKTATASCYFHFDPETPQTYGKEITVYCDCDTTQVTPTMYRNATNVTDENYKAVMLAAAHYDYSCNASGTRNYTVSGAYEKYDILKASTTTTLYIDGAEKNATATYGTQTTAEGTTSEGTVTLYRNGTATEKNPESITLAAGYYNYTAINPGNQNYSGSNATLFLTVNKAPSSLSLLLNGTAANRTIERGTNANITATKTTGDNVAIYLYRNGTLINSGTSPLTNTSQYSSSADHNITASYAESQNYSASSQTYWLLVRDTTAPGIISGLGETATGTTWIRWAWTNPTDADFSAAILYLNGTNIANTSNNYYNATGISSSTTYQLTVRTKDTSGNVNTTNVSDNAATQDGTAPQYSDIKDQNNTAYTSGGTYQFNVTWTDNVAVNEVKFEFNGVNYTNPSSNGAEYYISMSNLAAGSYTYAWHANDFLGNANSTATRTFVVAKGTATLNLSATPGWSTTYGTQTTVNCSGNVATQLYRNGTLASIPDTQTLAAVSYYYVCNASETTNYSATSTNNTLAISKAASSVNLLLNGTDSDISIERLAQANITATKTTGDNVAIYLYINGTPIDSGLSPLTNISQYTSATNHNITVTYPESQNYTASSETHIITVGDTTPPGIASGIAESLLGTSWILWNWTNPSDADFGEAIIYVNGTNVANTSNDHYNATGLSTYTLYQITLNTKDTYGNVNSNDATDTATTLDNTPPEYSAITDNNGTTYAPVKEYQFNATWTDNVAVDDVVFEFEGTNYTNPSANGAEYYISMSNLAAGSHTYKWHASDTAGNWNNTGTISFMIEKAATTLNITAIPGWTTTYGTQTTVACYADNNEVAEQLQRNGEAASTPHTATLAAGSHNYTCSAAATQNYSAAETSDTLTINKAASSVNLLLNGTDSNVTVDVGSAVNETAVRTSGESGVEIYESGVLASSGASPLTKVTTYNTLGTFNVTAAQQASTNYTYSEETHWITVSDTTDPTVTLISPTDNMTIGGSTQTFMFNFTDNYYSTADCTLYINETPSGTNSSAATGTTISITNTSLPEGENDWHVNCTDGSGNTGGSETRKLNVDRTPPVITPIMPLDGETIGYIVTFQAGVTDNMAGIDKLYVESRNSTGSIVFAGIVPYPYALIINTSVYADGQYNLTGWANDTVGNMGIRSITHYISNMMPFIQVLSPPEDSVFNSDFNLVFYYQDDQLEYEIFNITYQDGTVIMTHAEEIENETLHIENETINTTSLNDGNYTFSAWTNDTTGYSAIKTLHFVIDKTAPAYSTISEPADPSTYSPSASYNFSIDWTDNRSVSSVVLEFNGTNYTSLTHAGNTYSKAFSPLAGGAYNYKWHARDEVGNWNSTALLDFTIAPATASCVLAFDKSSPQTYGTAIKANCSCSGQSVWATLWRDHTNIDATEDNMLVTLAAGSYAYECNRSASRNYTSASDSGTFVINRAVTVLNMTAVPGWSGATYGTETIISCSANNAEVNEILYRSGTIVTIPDTQTLSAGNHIYTCEAAETQNYTGESAGETLSITKANSSITLKLDGTASNLTIERGTSANLTAEIVIGTGNIELYRNGTLLGSGTTVTDLSTYSTATRYNITATYAATQNHSSSRSTLWLTVSDTVPPAPISNLLLLNKGQNYLYWVWTNPTDADFHHTNVYLNGAFKTSISAEYYYATSLNHSTNYTLSLRTVDNSGTVGDWVNDTQMTQYNCTESWATLYTACRSNDTRIKYYNDTTGCGTTHFLPADNGTVTTCDYITSTKFNGSTTNFTRDSLAGMSGVVLEITPYGRIDFLESITIARSLDLDTYANIGPNHASIGSSQLAEFNKSANITLYNVNFTAPRMIADGAVCNSTICNQISYSNGTFVFNVTHFTNYSVQEGPYCGDSSCNGDETCNSCSADCGSCSAAPAGGGGGGGGGGGDKKAEECAPNWLCYSWNPCVDYRQNRKCFDSNGCGTEAGMPETEKSCLLGCAERWACGDWGKCADSGVQTRSCNDLARCDSDNRKPLTVQPCEYEFCSDGRQNNGESGIDCGGTCRDCTREELQEVEMKKNLLTGEAIAVEPYEPPNPFYLTPILLLLVLLIAVIALSKANLSERGKKILTAAHVLLILSIIIMILTTFKVPQTTGEAVREVISETGIPSTFLIIIAAALMLGIGTYAAVKSGVDAEAFEQYYNRSKYWAGYAVQKFAWQHTKKKEKPEIIIEQRRAPPEITATSKKTETKKETKTETKTEMKTEGVTKTGQQTEMIIEATKTNVSREEKLSRQETPAREETSIESRAQQRKAETREEEPQATIFQSLIGGVGEIDLEIEKLEQEISKMRAEKTVEKTISLPKRKTEAKPAQTIKKETPRLVKQTPVKPTPAKQTITKQTIVKQTIAKQTLVKQAAADKKKESAKPKRQESLSGTIQTSKLQSKFGTEDPLKIAERILKMKTRR